MTSQQRFLGMATTTVKCGRRRSRVLAPLMELVSKLPMWERTKVVQRIFEVAKQMETRIENIEHINYPKLTE